MLVHYPRHLIGGGADLDPINKEKRRVVYGILEEYAGTVAIIDLLYFDEISCQSPLFD